MRLIVWFRRRLPRPRPPEVRLWHGTAWYGAPAAVRYDGVDEAGIHQWTALFDERLRDLMFAWHVRRPSRRNRIEVEFLPAAELARAVAELERHE